eukprot:g7294.t1
MLLAMLQLLCRAQSFEVAQNGEALLWRVAFLPMAVFMFVYFSWSLFRSKALWFDGICVDQGNLPLRAKTMEAVPVFASEAASMLVVWHESLFSKLWCVYEIAVRAKNRSFDSIHVVPVWLPCFSVMSTVSTVLSLWILSGFVIPACESDPTSRFVSLFGLYFGSPVAYIVFAIPITHFCSLKIESHKTMLDQMESFDLRNATCSLETDRLMIRRQVLGLFDEALQLPLSVSLEAEPPGSDADSTHPEVAALLSPEDLHSFRHVTSYPSDEEVIDEFNSYVRGPLRESVVRSLGREDQIPLQVCLCAFWPVYAGGLALTAGCNGHRDCQYAAENLKFQSVTWYLVTSAIFRCIWA